MYGSKFAQSRDVSANAVDFTSGTPGVIVVCCLFILYALLLEYDNLGLFLQAK